VQLVAESPLRLGDVQADGRARDAERAGDIVVGAFAVADHGEHAATRGRQRIERSSLHLGQLRFIQLEVGLHPAVDAVGHIGGPVTFAGPAIGVAAQNITRAPSGSSCGEGLERAGLPLEGAIVDGGEDFEGDILGDVLGGVVIHERQGGTARDGEDTGEQAFVGGDVENDGGLHDGTRLHVVG